MPYGHATRYLHAIVNDPGTLIEGGKPIIVHGIIFSDVTDNAQLLGFEKDGIVPIFAAYVDSSFSANPTNEFRGPFLAKNGLILYGVTTFGVIGGGNGTNLDVTIFYSHVGA